MRCVRRSPHTSKRQLPRLTDSRKPVVGKTERRTSAYDSLYYILWLGFSLAK